MPTTGLSGPYKLDAQTIDKIVTKTSAGAYALGRSKNDGYYVDYVGRSDGDVNKRLKDWVGNYTHFKFDYFSSPKAAFEKECNLYHDFKASGLDNDVHPARPANTNWECPRCTIFD